jgi:thymidylate synthase (FAD)
MKVELINFTPYPVLTVMKAIRICHDSEHKSDTKDDEIGPNDANLLKKCIDMGHTSVLEHVSFTFQFQVSRVTQTQLVRHRLSTFSIESQRHVEPKYHYVPESISNDPKAFDLFMAGLGNAIQDYNQLLKYGISKEDARYILPMAMCGKIMYTTNLRNLRNAIAERTCVHSQLEIRRLFTGIKNLIMEICPVFMYRVAKCHNCKNKCHYGETNES